MFKIEKEITNLRFGLPTQKAERERNPIRYRVFFRNGFVWVTNGFIMFRSKIENYVDQPEAAELLEGYSMGFEDLTKLKKYKKLEIEDKNPLCVVHGDGKPITTLTKTNAFPTAMEEVLSDVLKSELEPVPAIGVDASHLLNLAKCFYIPNLTAVKLEFYGDKKPVKVTQLNDEFDQVGVIMPHYIG